MDPEIAGRHAEVVATGRSDFPNQINNVLGISQVSSAGSLDAGSSRSPTPCSSAAADAIAARVSASELNPRFIIPSVFDPQVAADVATAVQEAVAGK